MELTEPVTSREMGGLLNQSTTDSAVPIGNELWRNALCIAKMNRAMSDPANYQTHRQRTSRSASSDLKLDAIRVQSRLNALVPKLESLTPMQGKDFVISVYRRLAHPRGVVKQVAWSPSGHLLLTRLSRSINVWTQHGILQKTISRPTIVESIVWLPSTDEDKFTNPDFLSVEGSKVVRLSSNSKIYKPCIDYYVQILGIYKFGNMNLQGIAVTPDGNASSWGRNSVTFCRWSSAKSFKNGETDRSLVPVLSNVKGITVVPNSHNELLTLISYEDKATPQLWKLDTSKNTSRLTI
ncbi:hypothetical protein F5876DRAFT_66316 [Lentinula aff. lateritia]|uniref:Uncharacterized protein n=1 Tax=Lentinula aff. lateritia TaxID=2804960 RepID=A0ACC1TYE5_9AGAR|nr:hypothetical protein F5876DRAFT_66316 [Lentinula aff. lateritia]